MLLLRPCAASARAAAARRRAVPLAQRRARPCVGVGVVAASSEATRTPSPSPSPSPSAAAALASPPNTSSSSSSSDEDGQAPQPQQGEQFGVSARQLALLMQAALEYQSAPPPSAPASGAPSPGATPAPAAPLLLPPGASTLPSLATALRTSLLSGPPGDEADLEARRRAFGTNLVPPPPLTPYWRLLLEALSDPTLLLLSAAGLISLLLAFFGGTGGAGEAGEAAASSTEWVDGAAILASVAVCSAVAAGTNFDKQSKFRALAAARDAGPSARVLRGGRERAASAAELVVGDVLLLEAGDILPADALLLPAATATGATAPTAGATAAATVAGTGTAAAATAGSATAQSDGALLRVDESHLTGESDEVAKAPLPSASSLAAAASAANDNNGNGNGSSGALTPAAVARSALYSGSKVLEGYGRALVVAVGPNSQQGLIAALVAASTGADNAAAAAAPEAEATATAPTTALAAAPSSSDPDLLLRERTRLAAQLEDVAGAVGRAGAAAAGAVFGANVLLFAVSSALPAATAALDAASSSSSSPSSPSSFFLALLLALSSPEALREYLRFFTASVAVLVVAVPEGLPLAVTLALAFGVSQMLEERNLVRRLDACEAMALCTSVCSDKTGTLTENDMRVVRVVAGGRAFAVRPSARRWRGGSGGEGDGAATTTTTTTTTTGEEEEEDPTGGVLAEIRPQVPARRSLSDKQSLEDADVVTMVSLSLDSREEQEGEEEEAAARRRPASLPTDDAAGASSSSSPKPRSPFPYSLSAAAVLRDLSVACIALTSTASVRRKAPAPPSSAEAGGAAATTAAAATAAQEPGRGGSSSLQLDRAGNRTECALLEFAGRLGGRLVDASATAGGGGGGGNRCDAAATAAGAGVGPGAESALDGRRLEVAQRLVFSSERKRSSAVLEPAPFPTAAAAAQQQQQQPPSVAALPEASWPVASAAVPPGAARVYVKGAADVVLARCTHVLVAAERVHGSASSRGNSIGSGSGGSSDGASGGGNGATSTATPAGCVAVPLTARDRSALLRLALGDVHDGAEEGGALRLLALAYRDAPASLAATSGGSATNAAANAANAADDPESGLTLIALAGLEDPIRAEAEGAVRDCARAGIRVRMLTGDSPATAAAIAQQCGILPPGRERRRALLAARERRRALVAEARAKGDARAALPPAWDEPGGGNEEDGEDGWALMDGAELRALILRSRRDEGEGGGIGAAPSSSSSSSSAAPDVDLDALARLWPRLRVVARCTPADKHALVAGYRALRRRGAAASASSSSSRVLTLPPGDDGAIAVTGDGTNDAPALAAADVGFSMASGTAVAKESADILLLDDNFASVVTAVRWGRNVHRSVARFLTFQLSASVVAVSAAAAGALLLRGETVLAPVQLLWVNLIVDSLASLALATEPPPPGVLDEPPRRAGSSVVSPRMAAVIGAQAAFQLVALGWLLLPTGGGSALGFVVDGADDVTSSALRAEQLTLVFNSFVAMSLGSQVAVRAIGRGRRGGGGAGEGAGGSGGGNDANSTTSSASPPLLPALLRPLEGLDRAPLFVGILALEAALQGCIVQWGGRAFSTVPLSPGEWGLSAALGVGALFVGAAAAAAPGIPDEWPDDKRGYGASSSGKARRLLKDSDDSE